MSEGKNENYLILSGEKIELSENITNQVKELIIKEKIIKQPKLNGWKKVTIDNKFYYIDVIGNITVNTSYDEIINDNALVNALYNNLNYFSTEEKAEEVNSQQLLWRKLKKFADENNEPFTNNFYWEILYNFYNNCVESSTVENVISFNNVLFSSKEIADKAIGIFEDELIDYFSKIKSMISFENEDDEDDNDEYDLERIELL